MTTITKFLVFIALSVCTASTFAQQDSIIKRPNGFKIDKLIELKKDIQTEEREFLKKEVEQINKRLDTGEITQTEADNLKKKAAKKRAQNIDNRLAILDNKIALLKRNESGYDTDYNTENEKFITISIDGDNTSIGPIRFRNRNRPRRFDRRTSSTFVLATGLNNTIIDGESFNDSPYRALTSGFFEMGWAWKTRVFENSNFVRLKYGVSFQWNKLKPKDNQFFVQEDATTTLETFPTDLKKSKFRVTNLVVPVHFEFGSSRKIEHKSYFRYRTNRQFKIGIGGYGGFRIGALQKLKYKENGDRIKQKIKRNYNTSNFVYGLSGYVGIGEMSLYAKYDLNPLFKDQAINQHNVSLGLRFDFD